MSGIVTIIVDGAEVEAPADQPLGALLHALGKTFRRSPRLRQPRALFCGMGICFECVVTVDGAPQVRACITPARDGMRVDTGS